MSRQSYRLRSRDIETTDTDDDATVTPRAAIHRRTLSNATNMTNRSIKSSSTARDRERRRRMVRQSLIGPQVHELTIEERAGMLIGVAGDCLVKTIRAGLDWNRRTWVECSKAWKGFQTLRQTYIFTADAPAIISFEDAVTDLRRHSRHDFFRLSDAIDRCNLATLAYVILRPDECWTMAARQAQSRKGKERAPTEAIQVAQRNEVLILAWESFWTISPEEVKAKEEALRLWLDFATQIFLTYRCPMIDPSSSWSETLPAMTSVTFDRLFNSAAIVSLGRWEMGFEDERTSGISGLEQEVVERRWAKAAQRRRDELERSRAQKSLERHPYDTFRKAMIRFIDANFVKSGFGHRESETPSEITHSEASVDIPDVRSSRRSVLRANSTRKPITRSSRYLSDASVLDEKEDQAALSSKGITSEEEVESDGSVDNLPLRWDILAEAAHELENQLDANAPLLSSHPTPPRTSSFTPVPYRPTDDAFSSLHGQEDAESVEEVPLRKAPGSSTPKVFRLSGRPAEPGRFNFAQRQADAVRVDWDSQTPVAAQGRSRRRASSRDHTPAPQEDGHHSLPTPESQATPRASATRLPVDSSSPGLNAKRGASPRRDGREGSRIRQEMHTNTQPSANFASSDQGQEDESDVEMRDLLPDDLGSIGQNENSEETEEEEDLMPGSSQLGYHDAVTAAEATGTHYPPSDEDDMESLLPDAAQIGLQPSRVPETQIQEGFEDVPAPDIGIGLDTSLEQANPAQSSPAPPQMLDNVSLGHVEANTEHNLPRDDDEPGPSQRRRSRQSMPTSQRLLASSRLFARADAADFELPNEREDEEDRALLIRDDPPPLMQATPRPVDDTHRPVYPTPRHNLKRSPPPTPRVVQPQYVDPFLLDADGSALEPNEDYRIPADHVELASRLHGRIGAQSTQYSRLAGKMKWTEAESLLLYRTVQKVPENVLYPLRVVWYLHGEHGTLSQALQWHNPQHMKDKMRTIVDVRVNNQRAVAGRARAFLPPTNPARVEYEQERQDYEEQEKRRIQEELAEVEDGEDQPVRKSGKRKRKAKAGPVKQRKQSARQKRKSKAAQDRDALEDEEGAGMDQQVVDDDDLADSDYVDEEPTSRAKRRKSLKGKSEAGPSSTRVTRRTSQMLRQEKRVVSSSPEPETPGPSARGPLTRFVPQVEVPARRNVSHAPIVSDEEHGDENVDDEDDDDEGEGEGRDQVESEHEHEAEDESIVGHDQVHVKDEDETDLEEAGQVDEAIFSVAEDELDAAPDEAVAEGEEDSNNRHERAVREALLRDRVYGMVKETA